MFKSQAIQAGWVDLETGFDVAIKDARERNDTGRVRYFSTLKSTLRETLGPKDPDGLKAADVVACHAALKKYCKAKFRSDGYRRNLASHLNKVIALSPVVENRDELLAAWKNLLIPIKPETSSEAPLIPNDVGRWLLFVKHEALNPENLSPDRDLKKFAEFLVQNLGLSEFNSVPGIKRNLKRRLQSLGYKFHEAKKKAVFDEVLEKEIATLHEFAVNGQLVLEDKASLFAKRKGNPSPISPESVRSRDYTLRGYLDYLRSQDPGGFAVKTLREHFQIPNIENFLDHAHKNNLFTRSTAMTFIDRIIVYYRYCCRIKIRGFADAGEKTHEKYMKGIYKLIPYIKDGFPKLGINARIKEKGGLPWLETLHDSFMHNAEKDLDHIKKLQRELSAPALSDEKKNQIKRIIALRLRKLLEVVVMMTFSSRPKDLFQSISVKNVKRLGEYWSLSYYPTKTRHHFNPPEVDNCLPPWFTDIFELYLEEYRPLIWPGSELLFPADKKTKDGAGDTRDARSGNQYQRIMSRTHHYLGQKLSEGKMRKILTSFFKRHSLPFLFTFKGHSSEGTDIRERGGLTKIESRHYDIPDDQGRIKLADFHYGRLHEILKIPGKFKFRVN